MQSICVDKMELSDKSVKMKGIFTSDALFYFKRIANVIYGTSSSPSGLRISSNAGILASIKTNDKSGRWAEPEVLIGKLYKLFFFKLIGIETDVSFHSNCSFISFFFFVTVLIILCRIDCILQIIYVDCRFRGFPFTLQFFSSPQRPQHPQQQSHHRHAQQDAPKQRRQQQAAVSPSVNSSAAF